MTARRTACTGCRQLVKTTEDEPLCVSCTGQPSLFDDPLPTPAEGRAAGVLGRERAYEAAEAEWRAAAGAIVEQLARAGDVFTSNDVWRSGLSEPPTGNRRALGGVLIRAAKHGLIVKVGDGALSLHGHGSTGNAYWKGTAARVSG